MNKREKKELLTNVSKTLGLTFRTVSEMFEAGWTLTMNIDGSSSWTRESGWALLENLKYKE